MFMPKTPSVQFFHTVHKEASSTIMTLKTPPLGGLKFAQLSDVNRIGFVAAAAFRHSSFFPYSRPFYKEYPKDTVASYRAEYQASIKDPESVVLVALDTYKEDEVDFVYEALKDIYPEFQADREKDPEKVVVGVISLALKYNPKRQGQFIIDGNTTY